MDVLKKALLICSGCILLFAIIWIIFGRAVDSPFIYDDQLSIVHNSSIQSPWPLIGDAAHPGPLNAPPSLPTSGRPLVNYTFALNYFFGGNNPHGYHAVNIIIHVLSAILFWRLAVRILRLARIDHAAEWLAFIAAVLWAIHPLQTESVIYVTQRTELLAGFFYLATVYASLRFFAASTKSSRIVWLVLASIACVLGAAAKEVVVTAPVAVLLIQWIFERDSFPRSWPLYVGFIPSWILLLITQHGGPHAETAGFHVGIAAHTWWLTQTRILLMYLKLIVWPHPLMIRYSNHFDEQVSFAAIFIVGLIAAAGLILLVRKNPAGLVIALLFLILAPTLVIPNLLEIAAERRMYLPLAPIVLWLVAAVYQSTRQWRSSLIPIVVLTVGCAIACTIISLNRASLYNDPVALWSDNVRWQPDDRDSHNCLGLAIVTTIASPQDHRKEFDLAEHEFRETIRLDPHGIAGPTNLANLLFIEGRFEEAIAQYRVLETLEPGSAEMRSNFGGALFRTGHAQEAVVQLKLAVAENPMLPASHNNLGTALLATGDANGAINEYLQTIQLNRNFIDSYANLAEAYAAAHRLPEAITADQEAIRLYRAAGQTANAEAAEKSLRQYRLQAQSPTSPASSQPRIAQ